MTPVLCIFDLDGTLLNTITDLGNACNYALKACGMPTHSPDEYPHLVGNGVRKLISRALPKQNKTEADIDNVMQYFVPFYNKNNCLYTRPYDGIPELLQQLKDSDARLAVASNKYQQATDKIVQHFFPNTFDLVCGEKPPRPRKPDPQIINDIKATFPECEKILYIGDSGVDIETAQNANVPIIACTWGFCTKQEIELGQPDFIVNKPSEILNFL